MRSAPKIILEDKDITEKENHKSVTAKDIDAKTSTKYWQKIIKENRYIKNFSF